jgi:hypothetical protein
MALTYLSARHRDASAVEPEPCFSEIAVYIRSVVEFSLIAAGAIGGEEMSRRCSPASISATLQEGSSDRRDAITAPADP